MLRSVRYDKLRGFDSFKMLELGRINLIVGTNNCGKTTALEGVQMLTSPGDFSPIWSILSRRGEDVWDERYSRHMDIRRLFHGHGIDLGSRFSISAVSDAGPMELEAKIVEVEERSEVRQGKLFDDVCKQRVATPSTIL